MAAVALIVLVACTGDTDNPDSITSASPSIALEFISQDDFVRVGPGFSVGGFWVRLWRRGGYAGAVNLTCEGLPPGVTATFDPASLDARTMTSSMTFTVPLNTAPGSTDVTIRASGAGVADATIVLELVVLPPLGG